MKNEDRVRWNKNSKEEEEGPLEKGPTGPESVRGRAEECRLGSGPNVLRHVRNTPGPIFGPRRDTQVPNE